MLELMSQPDAESSGAAPAINYQQHLSVPGKDITFTQAGEKPHTQMKVPIGIITAATQWQLHMDF